MLLCLNCRYQELKWLSCLKYLTFIRNIHTVIHRSCTRNQCQQQRMTILFSSHTLQYILFAFFFHFGFLATFCGAEDIHLALCTGVIGGLKRQMGCWMKPRFAVCKARSRYVLNLFDICDRQCVS